jgi:hypothetical protein
MPHCERSEKTNNAFYRKDIKNKRVLSFQLAGRYDFLLKAFVATGDLLLCFLNW